MFSLIVRLGFKVEKIVENLINNCVNGYDSLHINLEV